MKIELIKKEELNGETWFMVKVDGYTQESTKDESKAVQLYNLYLDRHRAGFPRITYLMSEELDYPQNVGQ